MIQTIRICESAPLNFVSIKPFERDDCATLAQWLTDAETLHLWSGGNLGMAPDEAAVAVELCELSHANLPLLRNFIVLEAGTDRRIGFVQVSDIWPSLSARISGVLVGNPEERNRGVGAAIVERALEFAFENFGVDRVDLAVLTSNHSAIRCYRQCGFTQVGHWPQACGTAENMLDIVWMTCFRKNVVGVSPNGFSRADWREGVAQQDGSYA